MKKRAERLYLNLSKFRIWKFDFIFWKIYNITFYLLIYEKLTLSTYFDHQEQKNGQKKKSQ